MTTHSVEEIQQQTLSIAHELADVPGALLPILHRLQDALGYIPNESVAVIAKVLHLSRAEVHGVISFYHDFRTKKAGERTLYVCRAEACQSMGGADIEEHAKQALGVDWHQTTADKQFTLEPIYCLGNCACAPAVMLDTQVVGRVTPERLNKLIDNHKA